MASHQVTSSEIMQIKSLGFELTIHPSPYMFINANFPGFDVLKLVQEIEFHLKPHAQDRLVKKILFEEKPLLKLIVEYYTVNIYDNDHRLLFKRTFIKSLDERRVKHDFLVLPLIARGQRLGRKVIAFCLQHYLNMDVDKIEVHAALEDGGLQWAKAGFRATNHSEMTKILIDAAQQLNTAQYRLVERLYDDYYMQNPNGAAFPIIEWAALPFMREILRRNDWHGEINLKNSEDLFNFNNYVNG